MLLRAEALLHIEAFTHKSFYAQNIFPIHTASFYTQKLLHTDAFTHRRFDTQMLLHAEAFYT